MYWIIQRALFPLFPFTQLSPRGFQGDISKHYSKTLPIRPSLEIVMPTVCSTEMQAWHSALVEIAVLKCLYSTVHWPCSEHTGLWNSSLLNCTKCHSFSLFVLLFTCRPQSSIPPNSSLIYELELVEVQEPIDYATIGESDLKLYL